MKRLSLIVILFAITFCMFCAVKETVKFQYADTIEVKDIIDVMVFIFQENGFNASNVNENIGLLNTEWKAGDNILVATRLKFNCAIDKKNRIVSVNPVFQVYNSGQRYWQDDSLSEGTKEEINAILTEINNRLENTSDLKWEVIKK